MASAFSVDVIWTSWALMGFNGVIMGFNGGLMGLKMVASGWFYGISWDLPSGNDQHSYGKSPFLLRKPTISMTMFNRNL